MKIKWLKKINVSKLPPEPGVYFFKNKRELLYIGKAASIRERVKNHFQQPSYRDNLFINQVERIGFLETDSEIEALVVEAELIKKHKPRYNVVWRDDKNYFYVGITKETFPRVFWAHQTIQRASQKPKDKIGVNYIGPFVDGTALKKTLTYLRGVFPYYAARKHPQGLCPWCYINLCPGPNPSQKSYSKNIRIIKGILKGKIKYVFRNLKKEMKKASGLEDFEKAAKTRDQLEALERILGHAKVISNRPLREPETEPRDALKKLKTFLGSEKLPERMEAYDISNIQGQQAAGSMVTFVAGKPNKNFYRKFKIKISGKPNDTAMIREVLLRRFKHREWPYPNLILIDGGKPQLNIAIKTKKEIKSAKRILITALAKRNNELFVENRKTPILLKNLPQEVSSLILRIRDESHRFAKKYHHKLRTIDLLQKP